MAAKVSRAVVRVSSTLQVANHLERDVVFRRDARRMVLTFMIPPEASLYFDVVSEKQDRTTTTEF